VAATGTDTASSATIQLGRNCAQFKATHLVSFSHLPADHGFPRRPHHPFQPAVIDAMESEYVKEYYCAICGGPFRILNYNLDVVDEFDYDIIGLEDMDWVRPMYVVGRNDAVRGASKYGCLFPVPWSDC
jgi:hypothetical protein